jgi:putative transposase
MVSYKSKRHRQSAEFTRSVCTYRDGQLFLTKRRKHWSSAGSATVRRPHHQYHFQELTGLLFSELLVRVFEVLPSSRQWWALEHRHRPEKVVSQPATGDISKPSHTAAYANCLVI